MIPIVVLVAAFPSGLLSSDESIVNSNLIFYLFPSLCDVNF